MQGDLPFVWGIRRTGLYVVLNGVEYTLVPAKQFPNLILTLVGHLKKGGEGC